MTGAMFISDDLVLTVLLILYFIDVFPCHLKSPATCENDFPEPPTKRSIELYNPTIVLNWYYFHKIKKMKPNNCCGR